MKSDFPPLVIIEIDDPRYPKRMRAILSENAPSRLFARGNLELLDAHAVSFCGSRDASLKGIEAASLCARTAIEAQFVVTSGNARGVDRATHLEALMQGGATILVLPEGMDNFRVAPELREAWDWDRVLVLSQFDPKTIWRAYHAMDRNRTIMALSCAMVVVEAGEKGGTRAAGEDALKLRIPLFAVDYGFDESVAPGNRALISRGAKPLKKSKETGRPNLTTLLHDAELFCASVRDGTYAAGTLRQPKLI